MRNLQSKPAALITVALLALLSALNAHFSTLLAQGTAFTYQGRLSAGAGVANGNYDMQFYLRDTLTPPGNPVGVTNAIAPVAVSNGLFTVTLDFGANFPGADRWLEMGVRTNGAASYATLSPRQKLTPAPYAITAGNLSGAVAASQLSGSLPATQLSGTVADARLSANVALLNRNPQTFAGQNIFNSSVGIGTATPSAPLHVKQGSGSGLTLGSAALVADAQTNAAGIWGVSGAANGGGVRGECDNGTGAYGVYGKSANGFGVYGSGGSYGGFFESGATGLYASGNPAVLASSSSGNGVYGYGGDTGIYGYGGSYGGYFVSGATGLYASGSPAIFADGNVGIGTSSPVAPLHVKQGSGSGVTPSFATIVGDGQDADGIWGVCGAVNGDGMVGECDNGTSAIGVVGRSSSGYGVYGLGGPYGVYGSGVTYGVYGSSANIAVKGSGATGVEGYGSLYGVYGFGPGFGGAFTSSSPTGTGLFASGSTAIRTSGSVGINTVPVATLHVVGTTAIVGDNTADFYNPSIGPNHSHIHYGSLGDWYIRSASNFGVVVLQDQGSGANVGIGTSTPFYKLDVNGIIRGNNVSPSDARWKKNIAPLTNALDTIEQLRGVRYDWRVEEFPKINFEPGPQIGLIAQEVKKILPEAVSQDRDGFYSVAYSKLIPVLLEGMKEQQGQLRAKDARLAALEKASDKMRLELAAQKELTSRMQAEFVTLQKAVARLADKSASTLALNPEPAEVK